MRVLVCGGRDYGKHSGPERRMLNGTLNRLHAERVFTVVIHGDAGGTYEDDTGAAITFGADRLAGRWADAIGLTVLPFPVTAADWANIHAPGAVVRRRRDGTLFNAKAGPDRNQRMLDECHPDLVVAFPSNGTGTADMVRRAKAAGIEVIEVPKG